MILPRRSPEITPQVARSPIEEQQMRTVQRIGAVLGNIVAITGDVIDETGKLGSYTLGRVWKWIGNVRGALDAGLSGKDYPTGN